MRLLIAVGFVVQVAVAVSASWATTIGIFSDENCSSSHLCIPSPSESGTFYVRVIGANEACGGIDGAEFRIIGLPIGWTTQATPGPAVSIVIGNPFGDGVRLGMPPGQSGECVLLYTVVVTPPESGATATLFSSSSNLQEK
jgi:hypothetical protein